MQVVPLKIIKPFYIHKHAGISLWRMDVLYKNKKYFLGEDIYYSWHMWDEFNQSVKFNERFANKEEMLSELPSIIDNYFILLYGLPVPPDDRIV